MLEVQGHRVIVLVDRSGSMDERDCDGQTRYSYVGEKLQVFVPEAAKSAFGNKVTGIFFNASVHAVDLVSANDVKEAQKKYGTGGSTGTHSALEAAFAEHQRNPSIPTMVFLVTDGHPDSNDKVDQEIVSITQRVNKAEDFRVMVLTVGVRDSNLTAWLQHLDADLGPLGAKFDIVGQNNLQEVDFQEAAAELIASTTTNSEADAGQTAGKTTHRID